MNTIFKRISIALLAAFMLISAPALDANAMSKTSVNKEIKQLRKSIKKDKSRLPKLQQKDTAEASQYTQISGQVVSSDPVIIFDPNKHLYMHFTDTTGLHFDERDHMFAEGLVNVSKVTYPYGLWVCYDTTVAQAPHRAADVQARINTNQTRLKLLQNSKKEVLAIDGVTLHKGESAKLTTYFNYNTQDINKVTWKSSKSKVVKVSKDGTVKALKNGSATISAKLSVTGKTYKTVVNVMQ